MTVSGQGSQRVEVRRLSELATAVDDRVAVEQPLEIRLGFSADGERHERTIAITMRTPGHDDELAAGFLFSEGIVSTPEQITKIWHRAPAAQDEDEPNVVRVDLAAGVEPDLQRLQRHFYTTSSCGVCGKASLEALALHGGFGASIAAAPFRIGAEALHSLPERLRQRQQTFEQTGGLHAAALFDNHGNIELLREDVGRHNALDKLIGRLLLNGLLPLARHGVIVSGRSSFELVQKTVMAGCPMIAAIGAPSSLAVELALRYEVTLVGFLSDQRGNVYAGETRVNDDGGERR